MSDYISRNCTTCSHYNAAWDMCECEPDIEREDMCCKKWEGRTLEENKKPRIAEILGVEVGERFSVEGQRNGDPLYVDRDGWVRYVGDDTISIRAVTIAINHPDRIIRKPRWMDDEIEFVKLFQGSCKNKIFFERLKGTGILMWGEEGLDPVANSVLPYKLLPSLKEGERATASEIIGGAE